MKTVSQLRRRPLLLAGGLLILVLATGCTATSVRPVQESSERLEALQKISTAQDEQRLQDLSHDELLARARSYAANGNDHLARLHYSTALQKVPASIPALMGLGNLARAQGDEVLAGEYFHRVVELEPEHYRALGALGVIHRRQGEPARAEEYLTRALVHRGDDPHLLTELAITYDKLGQEKRAEPLYLQVTQLRPDSPLAWNNRGFNYLLQEKYDPAVGALQKAMELSPQDEQIINNLALALALRGDELRAFVLLSSTVGKSGAHNNLGYIYMTTGRFDEAEDSFRRAMEENSRYYIRARKNLDRLQVLRHTPQP